jgi:hypothetical protein
LLSQITIEKYISIEKYINICFDCLLVEATIKGKPMGMMRKDILVPFLTGWVLCMLKPQGGGIFKIREAQN